MEADAVHPVDCGSGVDKGAESRQALLHHRRSSTSEERRPTRSNSVPDLLGVTESQTHAVSSEHFDSITNNASANDDKPSKVAGNMDPKSETVKSPTMTTMTTGNEEESEGEDDDRVTINVSGLRFETRRSTLATHPGTLLGNAKRRRQHYDPVKAEYFFERGRHTFDSLLYYYQSGGNLHRPISVPLDVFVDDLRFYQLDEKTIEKYCANEGIFRQKLPHLPNNHFQRKVYTFG